MNIELRDHIETLLTKYFPNSPNEIGEVLPQLVSLKQPNDDIEHRIGPCHHRLIVNGEKSKWYLHTDVINFGGYLASTDVANDSLPQLSRIFKINNKNFRTTSTQIIPQVMEQDV